MSEPELTRALRAIAHRPDPVPDLFGRVADRVRRRRHRRYAVGSAAAAVVVLAFGGALAGTVRPGPPPPTGARSTTSASASATRPASGGPSASTGTAPTTGDPSPSGGSPTSGPRTEPAGPARCTSADLASYFAVVQPPQGGGPTLIGGITLYDRADLPCRVAGTITLTALDANGGPVPLRGPVSRQLDSVTMPASSADDPVGLSISLRGNADASCPVADRVTPDRFRFTLGAATVEVPNRAHGTPLWGCRGAIELLDAGPNGGR
ncbi:hypothetical protein Athai_62240 [Actinocatenispora thailandica]|uniref:DUF4232 domain-containing protein n=1 Tax=Actinocatenispora thailandica TaxID=227318 RepID=A0A7R7I0K9_9ACTN|nr:hypothetical protein [Actinocatenispora thailandica]BCJ38721.1 hypothetical protein Athai_62240 [Actinocatenispora thailandica]